MTGDRLGDILIRKRIITPDALDEALAAQVTNGGRLGTNLVELGLISLDQVSLALAELHGVEAASREALEQVSSATLGALDRKTCGAYQVIPLQLEPGLLHLAMIDPHDMAAIDTIGNRLDLTIQSYVAPQLRIYAFLELHYQIPRPKRYLLVPESPGEDQQQHQLSTTIPRALSPVPAQVTAQPAPAPHPMTGPAYPAASAASPASDADGELVFLDELQPATPALDEIDIDVSFDDEGETAAPAADLEGVIERLARASTRDEIVRLLSQPVFGPQSLSLVFLPRGELAVAMSAGGSQVKLAPDEIRALAVPLGAGSPLALARASGRAFCGQAEGDPIQVMIATFLRVDPPKAVCIAPVCIGTRTVNLLLVQCRQALPATAEVDIARLATAGSRAYRRLIAKLKGA